MLKYLASAGTTYSLILRIQTGSDTATVTVSWLTTPVTVPTETFSCVTYQWMYFLGSGTATITYHFVPGDAIVRYLFSGKHPTTGESMIYSRSELLSYILK